MKRETDTKGLKTVRCPLAPYQYRRRTRRRKRNKIEHSRSTPYCDAPLSHSQSGSSSQKRIEP